VGSVQRVVYFGELLYEAMPIGPILLWPQRWVGNTHPPEGKVRLFEAAEEAFSLRGVESLKQLQSFMKRSDKEHFEG